MSRFEDLRFAIGTFFLIVGALVVIAGSLQETADNANLDYSAGLGLIVFSCLALGASFWKPDPPRTR